MGWQTSYFRATRVNMTKNGKRYVRHPKLLLMTTSNSKLHMHLRLTPIKINDLGWPWIYG